MNVVHSVRRCFLVRLLAQLCRAVTIGAIIAALTGLTTYGVFRLFFASEVTVRSGRLDSGADFALSFGIIVGLVVVIGYLGTDVEDSITIELASGQTIKFSGGEKRALEIVADLLRNLSSEHPHTREAVMPALSRFGCATCKDSMLEDCHLSESAEIVIPHLERALLDSDDSVRGAARLALHEIRSRARLQLLENQDPME